MLDSHGNVAGIIAGPNINGPWGNMAVIDNGATATLFVSNAGFDVGEPPDDAASGETRRPCCGSNSPSPTASRRW